MSHKSQIKKAYKDYAQSLYYEHPKQFRRFKETLEDILGETL